MNNVRQAKGGGAANRERVVMPDVDQGRLQIPSLRLLRYGHVSGRAAKRTWSHASHWMVVYVASGTGRYWIRDEERRVQNGCFFLCAPENPAAFGPAEGEGWEEHCLEFAGPRVQEWLDTWLPEPWQVMRTDTPVSYRMRQIASLMASGDPTQADQAALRFEAMLFDMASDCRRPALADKTDRIGQLLDDLSRSIAEPVDARKLCERHCISLPTLRRLVHQATGYPLHTYLHRLKIEEAKRLLTVTRCSVQEIASRLGYKDAFYFSRLFKRFEAVSPLAYRQSAADPEPGEN